jgi:hypothetical protein
MEPTPVAVVDPIGEALVDARTTRAVLRQRRGVCGGANHAAVATGKRCDGACLAIDRPEQRARRKRVNAAAP